MCVGDVEHLLHLFFDCNFARECCQQMNLQYNTWEVENLPEWILDKLSSEVEDKLVKILVVLWGISYARNKKNFKGKTLSSSDVLNWSMRQVQEWQNVNNRKTKTIHHPRSDPQQQDQKWKRPELGTLKLNVDASVK